MTTLTSADELLDLLGLSSLIAPHYMKQLRAQVPAEGSFGRTAKGFAAALVKQHVLTPFQSKRLLAGKTAGFFIGKYRILDLIGEGGMGKVYLAEQTTMKRPVALKLLPVAGAGSSSGLARFSREARAVARLRHPNITQAYDFDQVDTTYFFAMEYVEGLNCQELVQRAGKLSPGLAAHLVRQAAAGLEHARQNDMVHRDIKPGNLIVEPDGSLKILDLGLVVCRVAEKKRSMTLADKDVVLGTADYIAPEQAINSHDVDIRADLYSLGGVFYFLLTGEDPYFGKTVAQKLLLHQTKDPTPVRELVPEVPEGVAAVVARMMAKDRSLRYQTPEEVREALAPFAEASPPFDAKWVRYPRPLVEKYIRVGGMAPSTSSVRLTESEIDAALSRDPSGSDTNEPNATSATAPLSPQPEAHPNGDLRRRRKPILLAAGAAVAVALVGVAVAAVLTSGGSPEPDTPAASKGELIKVEPLPRKATLGPGQLDIPLGEAVRRAPKGGTLTLLAEPDGWSAGTVRITGENNRNGGDLTLQAAGEGVVLRRDDNKPLLRLVNARGTTVRGLTLDGGGRDGPLVEVIGEAAGVTFRDVTFRNVGGDGVRLLGARGDPYDPVRFVNCDFGRAEAADNFFPVEIRARELRDRAGHVEFLGCRFTGASVGINVSQPVEGLTVRDCQFRGNNIGIKFATQPTTADEAIVLPVEDWRVAGWWAEAAAPESRFGPQAAPEDDRFRSWDWKVGRQSFNRLDVADTLGSADEGVAFAYAEIRRESAGRGVLFLGGDFRAMTVWVNGRQVFDHGTRSTHLDGDFTAVADLDAGVNRVWVRVHGRARRTSFGIRHTDGYVALPARDWRQVTVAGNVFERLNKAVVFSEPPKPGSDVKFLGNEFRNIAHHPILALIADRAFDPGAFQTRNNTDVGRRVEGREALNDAASFTAVPLNEG